MNSHFSAGLPERLRDAWARARQPRRWAVEPDVEIRLDLGPRDGRSYSVHVVPWAIEDDVVVIRSAHGHWEMPGGRLEPGEGREDAARRELIEEAGFEVVGPIVWFAALHLRRPSTDGADTVDWFTVDIGWCDGRIVGPPTNPPGDVATDEVHCGSLAEAVERLERSDRSDLALCYETAAVLRVHDR